MDNNKELEQITNEHSIQKAAFMERQLNANPGLRLSVLELRESWAEDKLAELELRLRKLESANGRTQEHLNWHTPLI